MVEVLKLILHPMLSLSPTSNILSIIFLTVAIALTYKTCMNTYQQEATEKPMQAAKSAAKSAASSISKTVKMSNLSHAKIELRPSGKRGHSDMGWLNTYHSFQFASHHTGPISFGSLRVLNEDRVAPGQASTPASLRAALY
jgi:hypothetical protein